MTLDEAFEVMISTSRDYHCQLEKKSNRNCVDEQSALLEFDTAINMVENHWEHLPIEQCQ